MEPTDTATAAVSLHPAPDARTLKIFLADDHTLVRDGIKTLIDAQPDMAVVGEAEDGKMAWERLRDLQIPRGAGVDVVVMDISMPNWAGAEATAKIKETWPETRILALSMHEDKTYIRSMLEAGASGYVLKRIAAQDLIRAIHVVAAGGPYLDPTLNITFTRMRARDRRSNEEPLRGEISGAALSHREEEVMRLVAQGFSNKEIGVKLSLSVKTVEVYKARSMEKLGLDSRVDIVRLAVSRGWLNNLP